MIQFNLLPDVKIEYLRARYRMRLIVAASILISAVSIFFFMSLFSFVKFGQGTHIKNLDKDIDKAASNLRASSPDLDRVLTVQNQLNGLPKLHDDKVISSRLFDYMFLLTPQQATISDVELDIENSTLLIKGNTDAFETVNKFADTLKFTEYQLGTSDKSDGRAFNNVVLRKFSVAERRVGADPRVGPVEYEIVASFEPIIFQNIKDGPADKSPVRLVTPNIISARSLSAQELELFLPQQKPTPASPEANPTGEEQ